MTDNSPRWRRYEIHVTGYQDTWTSHGRDEAHAVERFKAWWQNPALEIVARDTGVTVGATDVE